LWKYRVARRSRNALVAATIVSAGFHALVLLAFNGHPPPKQHVFVDDTPLIQMTMPDLKDDEEKPVETLSDDQAAEDPGIAVPSLVDLPTIVPVNAFVQPLEFRPDLPRNLDTSKLATIPVNIARGSASVEKLGQIFDVSQLDRQPQPILQPAPVFPAELVKDFNESSVLMEFIITTKGEVVAPRAIRSEHRRFEEAAIRGVLKWKFRPGYKAGRPVNTRTQIEIRFRVTGGD
jgi:protein TonB